MFLYINENARTFVFVTSHLTYSRYVNRYVSSQEGSVKDVLNFDLSRFNLSEEGWSGHDRVDMSALSKVVEYLESQGFKYLGEHMLVKYQGFIPDINGGLYPDRDDNSFLAEGWSNYLFFIGKNVYTDLDDLVFPDVQDPDSVVSLITDNVSLNSRLELFKKLAFKNPHKTQEGGIMDWLYKKLSRRDFLKKIFRVGQ